MTRLSLIPQRGRFGSALMDNIFEGDFPSFFQNEFGKLVHPSVNIKDTKDAYAIDVAAPGYTKENFKVKVEDNLLTISAEVKEDKLEEGEKFTRKEFSYSSFNRTFTLPKTIVADKITANYENGVLKITLPKMEEAKQKGALEVKIG